MSARDRPGAECVRFPVLRLVPVSERLYARACRGEVLYAADKLWYKCQASLISEE